MSSNRKVAVRPLIHGKASLYANGCRCDECREAWATYQREWRHDRTEFLRNHDGFFPGWRAAFRKTSGGNDE